MTTQRPKPAKANAKTALCKTFMNTGACPYGDKCTFAHGVEDLQKVAHVCWWYNNGGCSKSAEDCKYRHEEHNDMRKPLHLQHPCVWMHVKTPGQCRNKKCGGDHDYELTTDEWKHHFPQHPYTAGYLNKKLDEEFPNLPSKYLKMEFPKMNPNVMEFIPQRVLNPYAPVFVPMAERV